MSAVRNQISPSPFQYSLRIVGFRDTDARPKTLHFQTFQYSLRIVGFRDVMLADKGITVPVTFSIPCESWGSATNAEPTPAHHPLSFQYSLRIVGFRDKMVILSPPSRPKLSVFPANRGVPRPYTFVKYEHGKRDFQYSLRIVGFRDILNSAGNAARVPSFSIPCESWGSATNLPKPSIFYSPAFSIPCESWGSATPARRSSNPLSSRAFSIPCESWGSATITGPAGVGKTHTFSIPCESWGSATAGPESKLPDQIELSVFPANRGVPRLDDESINRYPILNFQYSLRIVGFRDRLSRLPRGDDPYFQYSLRIVGFRDVAGDGVPPRHRAPFSIPCESWGSATIWR